MVSIRQLSPVCQPQALVWTALSPLSGGPCGWCQGYHLLPASCSVTQQVPSSAGAGRGLISTGIGLGLDFVLDFLSDEQGHLCPVPLPHSWASAAPSVQRGGTRPQTSGDSTVSACKGLAWSTVGFRTFSFELVAGI